MKALFADTFYYLALLQPDDSAHDWAVAITRGLRSKIVTTAWVLMEVGDALAAPANRELFLGLFDGLRANTDVKIVSPDQEVFDEGAELFRSRSDKGWTLTDCTSFVVMKRENLTDALTGDHHFDQAGFKALLK